MALLLAAALIAAIVLRTPEKCAEKDSLGGSASPACAHGRVAVPDLPSFALGQPVIYHVEVVVLLVFAGLLVATPAVAALSRGAMPLEISTEGIKVGENALLADDQLQESVEKIGLRLSAIELIVSELQLRLESAASENGARHEE